MSTRHALDDDIPAAPSWAEEYADKQVGGNLEHVFAGSQALSRARNALLNGALVQTPGQVEWDVSGNCTDAITLFEHEIARDRWGEFRAEIHARKIADQMLEALQRAGVTADQDAVTVRVKQKKIGMKLTILTRCRKCDKCLRARAFMWATRARNEIATATRTWFGTLTLRPEVHQRFINVARVKHDRASNDFDALDDNAKFKALASVEGSELTLWLKRVRKSAHPFRYLLISEPHSLAQAGLPHFHCLLHETSGEIGERIWRNQWKLGHAQFKLVDPLDEKAAWYATKYLTKSAQCRVRASLTYGLRQKVTREEGIHKERGLSANTKASVTMAEPAGRGRGEANGLPRGNAHMTSPNALTQNLETDHADL